MAALLAVIGAALAWNAAAGPGRPEVLEHHAALHPENSLIAEVRITLNAPARVAVEYENPQAGRFVTALSEPGLEHRLPVVRLRPETVYDYTIKIHGGEGAAADGPSGEFTTGPLPPELDSLQIRAAGRSSLPLIASDYRNGHHSYYFFWDETGNIVWYYMMQEVAGLPVSPLNQVIRPKPNGNLLFLSYRCCIVEITPLGQAVDWVATDRETGRPHHDFLLLDDGRILYLTRGPAGRTAESSGVIDRLMVWHQADGRIEEVWDPRTAGGLSGAGPGEAGLERWRHSNSISLGADGQLIVSYRNPGQLLALSPDFRRVEWRLGGPDGDYEFPNPSDRFYGQHTAAQLPNGRLLMFDNGWNRPESEGGAYSRALELRLDAATGAAVKVWEYRHRPARYSEIASSAFRLNNGHTLVNFGINTQVEPGLAPLTIVEVERTGAVVFQVESFDSGAAGWEFPRHYRAAAGPASIMGETMLRRPAAGPDGFPQEGWWRRPVREAAAFAPHLAGRQVIYRREPCHPAEAASPFFLHLFPVNPGDLPAARRDHGFENRDFRFGRWGTIREGRCQASIPLPDYPVARIRTGQYMEESGERLWEVELPGPALPPEQ